MKGKSKNGNSPQDGEGGKKFLGTILPSPFTVGSHMSHPVASPYAC